MNKTVSPTRTYVAICSGPEGDSYYFRYFSLPSTILLEAPLSEGGGPVSPTTSTAVRMPLGNDSEVAAWYYIERIDSKCACVEGCYTIEDFGNLEGARKIIE